MHWYVFKVLAVPMQTVKKKTLQDKDAHQSMQLMTMTSLQHEYYYSPQLTPSTTFKIYPTT
jgi:hypothetical protein